MDSRFRKRQAFQILLRSAMSIAGTALLFDNRVDAQCCDPVSSYRLQTETVLEQVPVTSMRIEYEERMLEKEIVSYRPSVQERVETRQYTVRKPVIETSTRNETYTVYKQVVKTDYVDETTYVNETSQVEQIVTTMRPVTETQYQTQHVIVQKPITETVYQTQSYMVQRPVTETTMQTQQQVVQRPVTETTMLTHNYAVQRPVTETTYQTQNYTALQPVTTYQPAVIDAGGYVAQQYIQPGDVRYHLRWQRAGYDINPLNGTQNYQRGGLGWVPFQAPSQNFAQVQYQPNYQQVAVPQQSFMPQTISQQVPVQSTRLQTEMVQQQVPVTTTRMENQVISQQIPVTSTRMQSEMVQQQVPVTTTRMENQVVTQQVPIQTQRMEAVQEKVMVPKTVQKPVTRKVARERIEYVPETHVRPIQTQTTTYKPEIVSEDVVIRTPIMERIVQKVQVPQRIARSVPYTEMRTVARTYTQRVPIDYVGPIISSYPAVDSSSVVTAGATTNKGALGQSVNSSNPATSDGGKEVESKKPETSEAAPLPAPKASNESKGSLSIGPPEGDKAASESSSSTLSAPGKITLKADD